MSPEQATATISERLVEGVQHRGHIGALDGIRGTALILVFAYHAFRYTITANSAISSLALRAVWMGWIGVDLFFVLSGFLITTILLDARAADNYFRVFYARRALRIFPLYYLVLIGTLVFVAPHYPARTQVWYWLNLSNLPTAFYPSYTFTIPALAHFWSLAIEEQFYLVWPSVVRWVSIKTLARICMGVILAVFVARNLPGVMALDYRWPELIYRLTPFRVDTLSAGALLAVAVKSRPDLGRYRWHARFLCVGAGCAFVFLSFERSYTSARVIRLGYTSLVVWFASLIALALYPQGFTSRVFSMRFLRQTGKYSYAFYLFHPFLISPITPHFSGIRTRLAHLGLTHLSMNAVVAGTGIVEFGLLFGLCALSWRFFEGPILGFKRHFRYEPTPENQLA